MNRSIRQVVQAAAARECPVCVCGEEAGDPEFASLLAGLGVRELSLSPVRAASVRHALRTIRCDEIEALAEQALGCSAPHEVREVLTE